MYLTKEEERMLSGEEGEVVQRSMRLLVRLGEIYGADRMIPIRSVQIAGVSYKSIGDPGTEYLEDIAKKGARVRVTSFLNPAGMDLADWRILGFDETFAKNQMRIIDAFREMGVIISATCTPYLVGNLPRFREHIAWSESSAVCFANSVIGARTNREGGPSALAAAICGRTPNYGLHIDENRAPGVMISVEAELSDIADYGALGYHLGKIVKNRVPYIRGVQNPGTDELKALGGAMAASGGVGLYHMEGCTPEAQIFSSRIKELEVIHVSQEELKEVYAKLNTGTEPDIVILGCPHASLGEIAEVAKELDGKKLKKPLWVCTSRIIKEASDRMGFTEKIENAGGRVVADTCMVVAPIEDLGYRTTGVNSGKAAAYLPGFCKQKVVFQGLKGLIRRVI